MNLQFQFPFEKKRFYLPIIQPKCYSHGRLNTFHTIGLKTQKKLFTIKPTASPPLPLPRTRRRMVKSDECDIVQRSAFSARRKGEETIVAQTFNVFTRDVGRPKSDEKLGLQPRVAAIQTQLRTAVSPGARKNALPILQIPESSGTRVTVSGSAEKITSRVGSSRNQLL